MNLHHLKLAGSNKDSVFIFLRENVLRVNVVFWVLRSALWPVLWVSEAMLTYSRALGNGVSVLGDTQKPPRHCPGQPGQGDFQRSLQPQPFCDRGEERWAIGDFSAESNECAVSLGSGTPLLGWITSAHGQGVPCEQNQSSIFLVEVD